VIYTLDRARRRILAGHRVLRLDYLDLRAVERFGFQVREAAGEAVAWLLVVQRDACLPQFADVRAHVGAPEGDVVKPFAPFSDMPGEG
jgi:hypothetical protein